jgi:CHC2 zinc finger
MPTEENSRGAGPRSVIDEAKERVPVLDLADRLAGPGQLRRRRSEWIGNCVIPDHDDRVPSFCVDPEKDLFFCHGCVRGGDVVRLAQLVWQIDRADVAAAEVLMAFGHHVPARSDTWYAKQKRQQPTRLALEQAKTRRVQRRIYRWIFAPIVAGFEDADERRAEEIAAWEECGHIAFLLVQRAKEAA